MGVEEPETEEPVEPVEPGRARARPRRPVRGESGADRRADGRQAGFHDARCRGDRARRRRRRCGAAAGARTALAGQHNWVPIGPRNVGGRVRAIAMRARRPPHHVRGAGLRRRLQERRRRRVVVPALARRAVALDGAGSHLPRPPRRSCGPRPARAARRRSGNVALPTRASCAAWTAASTGRSPTTSSRSAATGCTRSRPTRPLRRRLLGRGSTRPVPHDRRRHDVDPLR